MSSNMYQKNNQLTGEDLTKTQVLNLTDLEEVAKYEKKTSKRPAIMLACTGLFAIIMGITYPFLMSAIDGGESQQLSSKVEKRKVDDTSNIKEEVVCHIAQPNNPDGTDTITTLTLIFNQDKLESYIKILNVNATVGNTTGPITVQNYLTGYKAFETNAIPGYSVLSQQTETGMAATVTINLQLLNKATFPEMHKTNPLTNVEYDLNADKNTIVTSLTATGYTCK